MNEYVDVNIIENGKVIGTTKVLHVTKEPETQNIKLEKVDIKTAYDNLLIKYAELGKEVRLLGERCNQLLKDKGELTDKIEKMKCCSNCDFVFRDGNCYYDKECKNKDHWKLRR